MALNKQPVPINFAQGVDTKSDPKQLAVGSFLQLQNSVFDTAGQLTKRNGFAKISTLPDQLQTTLTTLNDNLLATGSNLYAYSQDNDQWLNQGVVQPVNLSCKAVLRSSTSQVSPDLAVAPSGLACVVYMDNSVAYYQISDSNTGQQIVARTAIGNTANNPRVYLLGRYFIITFTITITATPHLQYIAIPINMPAHPIAAADISATVASASAGYDAVVANNNLYVGWYGSGSTMKLAYLTSTLIVSSPVSIAASIGTLVSMAADTTGSTPVIWLSYWNTANGNAYSTAYSYTLTQMLAPVQVLTGTTINELTSIASNGNCTILIENQNTYSFSPNAKTDFVSKLDCPINGSVTSPSALLRSVGLASKPFYDSANDNTYVLVTYGETNQPTYFLIDLSGNIYMRLAPTNGGGYAASQVLPTVTYNSDTGEYVLPYLIKDFLATVNKGTSLPAGTPVNAIYTQTGINLAKFSINTKAQYSSAIANALHLTGGQLWMYDSVKPVEHGFHVYPENIAVTTATGSGSLSAQTYFYSFTYEWTDNQGNLHRSAPSIPVSIVTTTASSTNTIKVPTLRLTYKTGANPVRIVGYRWSTAQQVYYQFTSLTAPTANSTTTDSVTFTDAAADSAILGQTILYTTGGVVENIAAPASKASVLFKNRLFIVYAEDPNLIGYSKPVIQNTPVEMSDLFTLYVAPTTGAQGSTGPATALGAMDDKLIVFKKDAIYYFTGTGPDITGAQNDFSDATYIASSVGCDNPNSIVLTPTGLMFQSDKGIWQLGRDLSTSYIGAPVELYNDVPVKSAQVIPGTNQVRFTLNNGVTLMYDYYYQQWGTFTNLSAISATLYQGLHTYLNTYGQVFQETKGTYLDGSRPVLMSFKTGWLNLAGLQGYERFYFLYLLGTYYTPFKLAVQLSYDYNASFEQQTTVTPDNYTPVYGDSSPYGGEGTYGGPGNVFEVRVFPQIQKCESFQITVTESYDPSYGVAAGAGLTLSGLNAVVGVKKGYRVQKASSSFG